MDFLNLNNYSLQSYDNQDVRSSFSISPDGSSLLISGNGWKKIALPYSITSDTVLEFDFRSTVQGEVHGIGFDSDNSISSDLSFQLYGTQAWGRKDFRNYASSAGQWVHYRIPVGQFFTGAMNFLTFTNDHDVTNPTGQSEFANIRIYQANTTTPPADQTPPSASLTTADISTASSLPHSFTVTYADNAALNTTSLDNNDIRVTNANGFDQLATFVSATTNSNGSVTATYRITAPGGAWDSVDNGSYTISLQPNQVTDTSGNAAATATLGSFAVNIVPPPPDTTAPTATLSVTNVSTAGTAPHSFTVTYADNTALNTASLDSNDIRVTNASSFNQLATFVSATTNSNGSITATYRITAPGGAWDSADNSSYTISLQANQVTDTSGNSALAASLGSFQVSVPTTPAGQPGVLNLNSYPLQSYGDQDVRSSFSISPDGSSLTLSGNGWKKIALPYSITSDTVLEFDFRSTVQGEVHGIGFDSDNSISSDLSFQLYGTQAWGRKDFRNYASSAGQWVHYRIPVGQFFTGAMNFLTFTNDHDVTNPTGQSEFANIRIYQANTTTPPADQTPPSASLTTADISTASSLPHSFTVTYADNAALNTTSLDNNDIRVTNANGFDQLATFVSATTNSNGSVTATYRIMAPGGAWDGADNGSYTVLLQANQVVDTSGNAATASTLGAFNVSISNSPPASLSPRLFISADQIQQIRAAIAVEGSHHRAAFGAMQARVDQNDWRVYDENLSDGNWAYARTWLAREAALLYQITGENRYANIAYESLRAIYDNPDPENRKLDNNTGLSRGTLGMGFAIAYDWAASGWTAEQRDWVKGQLTHALDVWPTYSHANLVSPWGSNWVAVTRGAELTMMLAAREESNRASRYATIKFQLQQHIETAYGTSGWTQEGNGYISYGGQFLVPAVYALRSVGDTSLDTSFNSKEFWKLALYAGVFEPEQRSLQFGVGSGFGIDPQGWTSLLLNSVPADQRPYYQFFYDYYRGIHNSAAASQKFDQGRAGTTWALLYYPTDSTAIDPDFAFTPTLADEDKGVYFFRNRWQDENDVLISFTGDFEWHRRSWDQTETFSLNLFAYGTRFIGGPGSSTNPQHFSSLLVDGRAALADQTGNREFFAPNDYGGYAIVDGGTAYGGLGLTSAKRHVLVDFSGQAGTAVFSTLDRIQDESAHTYTWQLNLGDQLGNDGIGVTSGTEGGLTTFVLTGHNGSYLKGWVLQPTNVSIVAGDPLQLITSGSNADLWVAMVVGTGEPPAATVTGTGLNAVLEVGNTRILYDALSNRIVSESTNAVTSLVSTPDNDILIGNAASNHIEGNFGNDSLTGGSGADTFIYSSPATGGDSITDFAIDDLFQISAAGFGGGLSAGRALSETDATTGVFVSGSTPTPIGSSGNFLYDTDTGMLSYDLDGNGPSTAAAIAVLTGASSLSSRQFIVVD